MPIKEVLNESQINSRNFNLDIKNPNKQDDEVGDPQELLEELKNAEVKSNRIER